MSSSAPRSEQRAPMEPDSSAGAMDVLEAWQQVWHANKLKWRKSTDVVVADAHLSLKSMLVCFACTLLIGALALVIWLTLMVLLAIGAYQVGVHWLLAGVGVLLLNTGALLYVKKLLSDAKQTFGMQTTLDMIFSSQQTKH